MIRQFSSRKDQLVKLTCYQELAIAKVNFWSCEEEAWIVSPLAGGSSSNGERLLDLAWLLAWPRFECLDGLLIIPCLI